MTRGHAVAIAAVCAVSLAACGQEPIPPVRIGTFPGPSNEVVFLAQHRGWLAPSEFRLVEFINDGEVMRAFRNGSIEAAFITVDEVLALAQSGMDPVILFVTAESRGGDAVIAHADVTSLADLRGRRVAVQVNSVSAYLLRQALKSAGLGVGDLQVVNLPPDRHRTAFLRRDVDAVVTGEPIRTQIVELGGSALFSSAALPFELVGVMIVRGAYLEQHGTRVSALCSAWRRAEADLRTSAGAREWVAGQDEDHAGGAGWHAGRGEDRQSVGERRAAGPAPAASAGDDRPDLDRPARVRAPDADHSAAADFQMASRRRSGRLQGLTVMPFRPSRDFSSLRFRLPLFLMLYCSAVALVLYVVADRVQEARFEQAFESTQLLRATEIQSRTERAAERNELDTGQREFGELAVFEELRAAVFVSPENLVVLSSRRDWSDRPLDLAALGLAPGEQTRVATAMEQARRSGRVVSQFSADRNDLSIIMPAALPLGPGDFRLDRRALILLVHDLRFAKSVNSFRLRQQFGVAMLGVLVAVLGLGVALHFFVTRRIEHLHGTMARFAAGEPVENEPMPDARRADEISHLFRHFTAIAASINREITVRRQAEYALQESEERFRSAMHHSPIGMALVATDGRFLEVNPALCAIVGYTSDEMLAMKFKALTHPDDQPDDVRTMTRLLNREIVTHRTVKRYFHKDGRVVWIQINSSIVRDEDDQARYFVTQVQDITESRRADQELHRVNRSLRTISNCNQVLVHATDESELLHQLCKVIVDDGGYRMAWVGLLDPDAEQVVRPVAHAGFEDGYLERLPTAWLGEGGGPTVAAIRSGRPAVCHDFIADPEAGVWSDEAIVRGYKSALALPLESEGRVFGALSIYSSDDVAFDASELTLLRELADDLAFGIQALRTRVNQQLAEQALESSEALLRYFIKYTPAAVAMFDTEMRYLSASDRWIADYRLEGQALTGRSHYEMFPDVSGDWKAVHRRVLAGAVERRDEDPFPRADGSMDWLEWEIRPWRQADGVIGGLIIFAQVITARKRSEQALRDSQSKLVMSMEIAGLAYWELDEQQRVFTLDDRFFAQLGTTSAKEGGPTMLADEYIQRFVPPEDAHHFRRRAGTGSRRQGAGLQGPRRAPHPSCGWLDRCRAGAVHL